MKGTTEMNVFSWKGTTELLQYQTVSSHGAQTLNQGQAFLQPLYKYRPRMRAHILKGCSWTSVYRDPCWKGFFGLSWKPPAEQIGFGAPESNHEEFKPQIPHLQAAWPWEE